MNDFQITSTEILQAIHKLKNKVTRTPEGIPACFVKRIAPCILLPLAIIFENCLLHNFVPSQWKESFVIPVFKKVDKSNPLNYRSISLTSTFSRIFESILHIKITQHLVNNSLLSLNQYRFISKKS